MKFTLSSLAMVAAPAGAFVVAKPWVSPPLRGGAVPSATTATEGGNKAGVSEVRRRRLIMLHRLAAVKAINFLLCL